MEVAFGRILLSSSNKNHASICRGFAQVCLEKAEEYLATGDDDYPAAQAVQQEGNIWRLMGDLLAAKGPLSQRQRALILKRWLEMTAPEQAVVPSVDPMPALASDSGYAEAVCETVYGLLRSGRMGEAVEYVRLCGFPWMAAMLLGREVCKDAIVTSSASSVPIPKWMAAVMAVAGGRTGRDSRFQGEHCHEWTDRLWAVLHEMIELNQLDRLDQYQLDQLDHLDQYQLDSSISSPYLRLTLQLLLQGGQCVAGDEWLGCFGPRMTAHLVIAMGWMTADGSGNRAERDACIADYACRWLGQHLRMPSLAIQYCIQLIDDPQVKHQALCRLLAETDPSQILTQISSQIPSQRRLFIPQEAWREVFLQKEQSSSISNLIGWCNIFAEYCEADDPVRLRLLCSLVRRILLAGSIDLDLLHEAMASAERSDLATLVMGCHYARELTYYRHLMLAFDALRTQEDNVWRLFYDLLLCHWLAEEYLGGLEDSERLAQLALIRERYISEAVAVLIQLTNTANITDDHRREQLIKAVAAQEKVRDCLRATDRLGAFERWCAGD